MIEIDETKDNIEFTVFNEGSYVRVEAQFKQGDPYLVKCKGVSTIWGSETILYTLFRWGNSFDKRFENCIAESISRLQNDLYTRKSVSNLNIKLTNKANENLKLNKYLLESDV